MLITVHRPGLLLSRDVSSLGLDPAMLRRSHARGALVRVRRGAYVETSVWAEMGVEERHATTAVAAAAACRSDVVVSHLSAAVLHGLPVVGAPGAAVHVLVPPAGGSRREHGFVKHARAVGRDGLDVVQGVLVTSVATTLVDVCLTETFLRAVVMTDDALRRRVVTLAELLADFESRGTIRGARRVGAVVEFADPRAASPLESVSRVGIRLLGLPDPVLQHVLREEGRHVATLDFWWASEGVAGEADGTDKYVDEGMVAGRSSKEALLHEKDRENAVRRLPEVNGFARWGWDDALDLGRLAARLASAGLVVPRRHVPGEYDQRGRAS